MRYHMCHRTANSYVAMEMTSHICSYLMGLKSRKSYMSFCDFSWRWTCSCANISYSLGWKGLGMIELSHRQCLHRMIQKIWNLHTWNKIQHCCYLACFYRNWECTEICLVQYGEWHWWLFLAPVTNFLPHWHVTHLFVISLPGTFLQTRKWCKIWVRLGDKHL